MDLAVGAKNVIITMTHNTREGAPKLVASCDYPLTGTGVVSKVYTDLAIVAIEDNQFVVEAMVAGISREELQRRTGAMLRFSPALKIIHIDEDNQPYLAPQTYPLTEVSARTSSQPKKALLQSNAFLF